MAIAVIRQEERLEQLGRADEEEGGSDDRRIAARRMEQNKLASEFQGLHDGEDLSEKSGAKGRETYARAGGLYARVRIAFTKGQVGWSE